MLKDWDKHFWFVIETIVKKSNSLNNQTSWETLRGLANYIPCQKCKIHFKEYLSRENTINQEWLSKLKYEIKIESQSSKRPCKKCQK